MATMAYGKMTVTRLKGGYGMEDWKMGEGDVES